MTDRELIAEDEDPDVALAVILGEMKGCKAWAAICLADAIRHGDYPQGWERLGGTVLREEDAVRGPSRPCTGCEIRFNLIKKDGQWVIPEHVNGKNAICSGSLQQPC